MGPEMCIRDRDEYTQIKSFGEKKKQGWVKERFLSDEPIAAHKLETLKVDLARIDAIKTDLVKFKNDAKESEKARVTLAAKLERIKKVSKSAVEIDQSNQSLKLQVENLQKQLSETNEKNILLEQAQRNEGIKLGIFAIALGALVGFVLPYLKPRGQRRKNSGIRLR